MRSILSALLLAAFPATAFAECNCTCTAGQAVPVCTLPSDIPPICQRLCPTVLNQSIVTQPVTTAIPYGNIMGIPVPSGAPVDPAAAAAALAAGIAASGAGSAAGLSTTSVSGGASAAAAAAAASAGGTSSKRR